MKVSVSLVTYNHAPFIRQAIESALMQQTNFDFEILIGEDDSNDGTRQIAIEYAAKYPEKIRLFLHDRKDVIYLKGKPTGRRNLIHNIQNARGTYIARLEGDDYWTSPNKLQEQVDFLDCNPDYAICSHDVFILKADGTKETSHWFKKRLPDYDLCDVLSGKFFPPTCSVLFRNHLIKDFPEWFYRASVADFPLIVLCAQFGKIRHLEQVSGVYRLHSGGVWSQGQFENDWSMQQKMERTLGRIELYEMLEQHMPTQYRSIIRMQISSLSHTVSSLAYRLDDLKCARKFLIKGIKAWRSNPEMPFIWTLKYVAILTLPTGYKIYNSAKEALFGSRSKSRD